MSARAIANRRILHNITNMEEHEDELSGEKSSGGVDELGDEKGVQADPTLSAASTTVSSTSKTVPLSAGENTVSRCQIDDSYRHKPFVRRCGKFESGSGSGDQDGMHTEDGVDIAAKKRKTRRGKPKHRKLKPYSKQQPSYQQRIRNRIGRPTKTGRQPPAPYNTNQFLIEDHNDLPDLEQKLASASASDIPRSFQKPSAPPRTRDSSFSIDSDEDFFYSSPEDEEEFLTKEFKTAYEDLHAERLGSMTKAQLIQEYIQLEAKVDLLTKRLRAKNLHSNDDNNKEAESKNGTIQDLEAAKKLKNFQQRIDDLIQQNEQLKRENESLRGQRHKSVSVDSESDSDSSSSNDNQSRGNCSQRSPESSPVPVSYQGRLDKNHRQNSSISSVDSESDSSSSNESGPTDANESPKSPVEITNGHATVHEIEGLPS
ncbi:protein HEXIM1-like [Leptopilina heterotoma]|uniref:protein HEXIM1-like n=1 Tax=Leptopilina heterotoma TaxID=63436 RepID=UPI001CA935BA|nr:protein HEXIM1-like [Leptopilina heterotoma]